MQWIDDATVEQRQNYIATTQAVTQYLEGIRFVGRQNEIAQLPGLQRTFIVCACAPQSAVGLTHHNHTLWVLCDSLSSCTFANTESAY